MIARLVLSSNTGQIKTEIQNSLSLLKLSDPHPDLLYMDPDQKLGIEQARKIKEFFRLKPFSAKGKAVILEDASKLTDEAQNSLLKTLEELPQDSIFIMGAKNDANFLPTILSRCQIIRINTPAQEHTIYEIEKLIQMDTASRFEYVEKAKDKHKLLLELTAYFRKDILHNSRFLKKLMQAEEWAAQNVNLRAILEYLMLEMPIQ